MTSVLYTIKRHAYTSILSTLAVVFLAFVYFTSDSSRALAFFNGEYTESEDDVRTQCTFDDFEETYLSENPHKEQFVTCAGFWE